MAYALTATLIAAHAGVRRCRSFDLTCSVREQIENLCDALGIRNKVWQIDNELGGLQIKTEVFTTAKATRGDVSTDTPSRMNRHILPDSVVEAVLALKAALAAVPAGITASLFVDLT